MIHKVFVFATAAIVGLTSLRASAGSENVENAGFALDFGNSSLSGAGKVIRATNLPVQLAQGVVYFDIELDFGILSDGSLGTRLISAAQASGPISPTSASTMNFLPGTYSGTDPFAGSGASPCTFNLANPSIGSDGRRTYVLTVQSAASGCPNRQSYTWQTGPAEGNAIIGSPNSTFVNGASLTYAYGVDAGNYEFRALQNGSTITIQEVLHDARPTSRALTLTRQ